VASSTEPTPASIGLRNTTWRYSPSRFEGQAASRGLTLFLSHTPVAVARRQPEARDRVAVRRPRSRGSRRRQGPQRGLRLCGYSSALPEQCVDLNIVRRPARLDPDQRPASKDAAGQNTPAHDSRDYVLRDPDRSKTRANPAGERRQRHVPRPGRGTASDVSWAAGSGSRIDATEGWVPRTRLRGLRPGRWHGKSPVKVLGCSMRPPLTHLRDSAEAQSPRRFPLVLSKIHVHFWVSEALRTAVDHRDRRNHRRTTYQLWRPVIVCGEIADARRDATASRGPLATIDFGC
jgi:hypothetical protein